MGAAMLYGVGGTDSVGEYESEASERGRVTGMSCTLGVGGMDGVVWYGAEG